ncbi:MAG: DUF362 domain-containing protein [Desulfomonilia bacterium]|jgi:uncharacterized protein (DUF362 family)|uniref:DUF362 domain-containing protein n=1 Tax=anaerobic digester metagenome TaxID=1263854 RepID=A0A485LW01_9ZZZZ|nr:DUF362 domain-containing protein [Pseudomonadota bacterium]HPD20470.1 DUF362 domain-containing protein [Deltaproteobacteria bacterium]HPX18828.1 DUF362 domain-containing protein [Deltaproteobacteria bacterium]HRS55401.1 DUF362 domain-containing protein [Desulfomonilia bacterium]HRV34609.1 DUF362 domain-containing protein [Desulfomonilia bacterium]
MKRRDFLKLAAGVAAAAVSSCAEGRITAPASVHHTSARKGEATVFLAGVGRGSGEDAVRRAVRAAAEAATDFSWLSRGDSVFIKPVLNSGNPYPATTSPQAIGAMIELLRDKGAGRVVVGDMSGIEHVKLSPDKLSGSSRRLMEASGMARAVLAAGGELHFFEEAGWDAFHEEAPASPSHWKTGIMMPDILKEMDHIVLMPRCARHVLAGSTLGLKAVVGYWRTDTRLEYHREASTLQEKTAEGNTVETLRTKQRLVVAAADKILATFGPDDGYVFEPETGLVIASTSLIAHDMVSLAWLLENRQVMPSSEKDGFMDTSRMVARVGNRYVVSMLGGIGQALLSETFTKDDIRTVWDDRVLMHACRISGGVPEIVIEPVNGELHDGLRKRLTEATSLPA